MPGSRTLPPVLVTTLVTLLLALQWWLGVSATLEKSVTTDELAHIAGGYSYWHFDDYRLQPENGNLPQRLAGIPWVLDGARIDTGNARAWGNANVWILGYSLFYGSGNNTDFLLLCSHGLMALTGTALGLLIFAWSRRLWGDAGGLFSLTLYAFCPNFLANAPLATSDVMMALALLAATGAWWRQTRMLDGNTLALSLAAAAFAAVTKFSCVLLLPICGLLVLARLALDEPLTLSLGRTRVITNRGVKLAIFAASGLAHVLFAAAVIWAMFGFRYEAAAPGLPALKDYFWAWGRVTEDSAFWRGLFAFTRHWHLLPDAYLNGFATVLYASAARGAFLNGEFSTTGWPQFFPYAFLVKTPWAQLAAYLLAGGAALAAWRALPRTARGERLRAVLAGTAPLLALFAVYWAFSITSHLNIGHRHILPTYPVLFIGAGLLLRQGVPRWLAGAAGALALWAAVESAGIRPHYLAFFNAFAGGPDNGWKHLVDSSLDWGQDLPGLARWLERERRPKETAYVSYAGSGDFEYEGIRALPLSPVYDFDKPRRWLEIGPGLYCIGATMLQDNYSDWRGDWTLEKEVKYAALRTSLAATANPGNDQDRAVRNAALYQFDRLRFARLCFYLRARPPLAIIGHSIFIYRLDAEEIRRATAGTLGELADAMDRALAGQRAP